MVTRALPLILLMMFCVPFGTWTPSRHHRAQVRFGETVLVLEVAETPEQIDRGLGGRGAIGEGMLFAFEASESRVFTMRDCEMALDLVYVDDEGVVLDVFDMQPEAPRGTEEARDDAAGDARYDARLRGYVSSAPARYVLELRDGMAAAVGIQVGERVVIEREWRASGARRAAQRGESGG